MKKRISKLIPADVIPAEYETMPAVEAVDAVLDEETGEVLEPAVPGVPEYERLVTPARTIPAYRESALVDMTQADIDAITPSLAEIRQRLADEIR